jgi:hypothetical protein
VANKLYYRDIPMMVFARQELEVEDLLGKVLGLACVHEERIITAIIHCDLNLLLQISHTPCNRECGMLF